MCERVERKGGREKEKEARNRVLRERLPRQVKASLPSSVYSNKTAPSSAKISHHSKPIRKPRYIYIYIYIL